MHLINYIKEGKLNRQKRDKVKKEKKKAVQVFFCFYFNTAKGMIIDVPGPKIVGFINWIRIVLKQIIFEQSKTIS